MFKTFSACVSAFAAYLLIASNAGAALITTGAQNTSTITPTTNTLSRTATSIFNDDTSLAATVTVEVSDINFAPIVADILTASSGTFINATGSTVTFNWYIDRANAVFGKTELIDSFSVTVPDAAESFSHNLTLDLLNDITGLFSMTLSMSLTLAAQGSLTNLSQTEVGPITQAAVPEPISLALLGIGLAGLALMRRSLS